MKDSKRSNAKNETGRPQRQAILTAVVIIAVVVIVAGVAVYVDQVAPFRTTVVSVGESQVSMRTFLKRANITGKEPLEMLQTLANEEIIKQVAPYAPYDLVVGDEAIDGYLKNVARGGSDSITDGDFKEWYRQQLNESRLSDREFRDLVRTNLLMLRLREYLAERVPTIAEQVHLNMIPVQSMEVAVAARERIIAGEDFAQVARELSTEPQVRENGGDIGWHARGSLVSYIARTAFDELEVGEISEPLFVDDEVVAIVMVSEKAAARELDEAVRRRLQDRALDDWLVKEQKNHEIDFHGFSGAYDSETDAWAKWQLMRMKRQD